MRCWLVLVLVLALIGAALSKQPGYARLDEDDIRVRPGRSTRPRTRTRPAHASAVEGFVVAVDRGRYSCDVDGQPVTAMAARELARGSVVVGDRVFLAGDVTGSTGSLARIVRVADRVSALRRSADDTDPVERVIVANAEQMVIVCALASPEPGLRFVDRCLVAAYDAGLSPLLVLTKADLAAPSVLRSIRAIYAPLGIRIISTRRPLPARTLGLLRSAMAGRISVLIGQSGVGKSTLVNALVPDALRAVGRVNPVTGRGRHTSSSAVAFPLPVPGGAAEDSAGWLIDTPGLRGFGLGNVSVDRIAEAFGDLAEGIEGCPPGCDHAGPEASGSGDAHGSPSTADDAADRCALDEWALAHHAGARLDSLRRLLASREGLGSE